MKFGKFQIDIISDGTFRLDGGAMFGIVPKPIWNRLSPADEQNRILLALDSLLVRFDDRIVVLEAGIGDKFSEKEAGIYDIRRKGGIIERLKELEIKPDQVTDVLVSHLHFDHSGSLTHKGSDGEVTPSFPRARHHMQKKHFEWANASSKKDAGSFKGENFSVLSMRELVDIHDGPFELAGDFGVFISEGHTKAQQHAKMTDGKRDFIFCGDLIPTSKHLGLPYNMGYDNYPLENLEEKEKLLREAAEKESYLYFYHDPEIKIITVKSGPKGFAQNRVVPFK